MSTTTQAATPNGAPRRGTPRWAWVLIIVLAIVAVLAISVAVFAARGREVLLPPAPTPTGQSTPTSQTSSASSSPSQTVEDAEGCLGGATELDRAVLTAQKKAPLSPAGAAAFTATLVRWASTSPAPPYQEDTSRQILDRAASSRARGFFSSGRHLPAGAVATVNFENGKYYVESFDGTNTIVSYVATGEAWKDGSAEGSGYLSGALHLMAVNGSWRLHDVSAERTLDDLLQVGTSYSGGC